MNNPQMKNPQLKNLGVHVLISLLSAFAAVMIYHTFFVKPAEQRRFESEQANADQIAQGLQRDLTAGAEKAKAAFALQTNMEMRKRLIGNGLSYGSRYKLGVAEHVMSTLSWPKSAEEIGVEAINDPESGVKSIALKEQGVVEIIYDASLGEGARITLEPSTDLNMPLTWSCIAHQVPDIEKFFPDCKSG